MVLSIVGVVAAVLVVIWILSVIWPFILGALVLIGMGAAAKGAKRG